MSGAGPRDGIYPRSVTPGIETQSGESKLPDPGVYIGLDWIRCTGTDALRRTATWLLRQQFGDASREVPGAKWFKFGMEWEPGVQLSWGHRNSICQVDVRGQRLRLMDGVSRIELLRTLVAQGMRVSRLDGAIDLIGQNRNVCVEAKASCERGELCVAPVQPQRRVHAQGVPVRRLLKLGSRSSPVCGGSTTKDLNSGWRLQSGTSPSKSSGRKQSTCSCHAADRGGAGMARRADVARLGGWTFARSTGDPS